MSNTRYATKKDGAPVNHNDGKAAETMFEHIIKQHYQRKNCEIIIERLLDRSDFVAVDKTTRRCKSNTILQQKRPCMSDYIVITKDLDIEKEYADFPEELAVATYFYEVKSVAEPKMTIRNGKPYLPPGDVFPLSNIDKGQHERLSKLSKMYFALGKVFIVMLESGNCYDIYYNHLIELAGDKAHVKEEQLQEWLVWNIRGIK